METLASRRFALSIALVALALLARAGIARVAEPLAQEVEVRATVCPHNATRKLEVQVATPSAVHLPLRRDYLPWARYDSIFVEAVRLDRGESIPASIPVSDATARTVDVPVGTRLVGDINLDERFPRLADVLKETDVAVFWAFRLQAPGWSATAAAGATVFRRERATGVQAAVQHGCMEQAITFTKETSSEPH